MLLSIFGSIYIFNVVNVKILFWPVELEILKKLLSECLPQAPSSHDDSKVVAATVLCSRNDPFHRDVLQIRCSPHCCKRWGYVQQQHEKEAPKFRGEYR